MAFNYFKSILIPVAFVTFTSNSMANSALEEFYTFFKSGQYPKAIEALNKIDVKENSLSSKAYLSGLSYARMQEYDQAIVQFEIAINQKNESKDLYYEYGQSLYADNELKKARESFLKSAQIGFNRPASLYYVAHISQILEDFERAREVYGQVIKDKETDKKLKQVAHFQLTETMLAIARETSKTPEELTSRVEKFILPMLNSAHVLDKSSLVAGDIVLRTGELMKEFNLDPNVLNNGRRISPKHFNGYVTQKIKFDDNISLTNEENNVQQSKKESYIYETEAYAKYDFIAKKRFIVSPETRLNYVRHSDQKNSEVYQNDSHTINLNLKNKYEHKFNEQPASLIFDIDYSRIFKDFNAKKKKEFYASSMTFTLGESFSYFNIGDTSLKVKRKNYDGENTQISNHTTSVVADQTFFFMNGNLLVAMFDASFIDNFNNSSTNTDTYLLRFDYIMPEIRPDYTLSLAFATTMTDTKEQEASRGTELSWNPSIDLSRTINSNMRASVNYDFTKNKSKDSNYSYNKHVFTTEFRYSF